MSDLEQIALNAIRCRAEDGNDYNPPNLEQPVRPIPAESDEPPRRIHLLLIDRLQRMAAGYFG